MGYWRGVLLRVALALAGAGVFYVAWLAVFLLAVKLEVAVIETALWLLAPLVTAAGFAAGVVTAERGARGSKFSRVLTWPLAGCIIGAGAVYWFGPMLIVFGMFVAGTASVALREIQVWRKGSRAEGLAERARRGDRAKFEQAMSKVPDVEPEEYDRL